jgi:hypothetical protein
MVGNSNRSTLGAFITPLRLRGGSRIGGNSTESVERV